MKRRESICIGEQASGPYGLRGILPENGSKKLHEDREKGGIKLLIGVKCNLAEMSLHLKKS
jgi:hypothetical protein